MKKEDINKKAFYGPKVDYPNVPVHYLIEQRVRENPDKVAVLFEDRSYTYMELNRRANKLAHYLIDRGFNNKDLIGIYMGRSVEMITAVLAVMKIGGTYIPLDSAYPVDRINYIISDAGMSLVLTQAAYLKGNKGLHTQAVCVDEIAQTVKEYSEENISCEIDPKQRMYVIYTSGSTGNPKGVQISHAAVVNFLMSMRREPGITENDRLLFITTICFDISGLELFLPLISGAAIIMATNETAMDGIGLAELIEKQDITIMQATPATWHMLIVTGWSGKKGLKILCGGEALSRELANELLSKGDSLWNMYGPTETTIWSMIHKVDYGNSAVPIGKPIDNTQVYILDEDMTPLYGNEEGELYIGGDGLSMGYLGKTELTGQRFLANPFTEDPSPYIYKTGDLVKYGESNLIEYVGRTDFQVKIRGHRIELGEIERVLEKHPDIQQAIAVVCGNSEHDKKIVAYYKKTQAGVNLPEGELFTLLKDTLPDYMIPAFIIALEEFPLTLNGKVDRKKLMELNIQNSNRLKSHVPPGTPIEKEISLIWEESLVLEGIGVFDNFLELGGHSLLANQILLKINKAYDIQLTIVDLLTKGLTISELAKLVEAKIFESLSESELDEMLKEVEGLTEEELGALLKE
ncbi:MAG TPA: amino acid adenylation domain-containing protein [Clostridia bacterium]|nr:amino acid adenylation domain-containing protein [Clostridia bacterium]